MNKVIGFASGLRLVVESIRNTKSLSIGVFVGVGSLYESRETNGISHFIEHMLFKGTEKRTAFEIVNELESIGVNVNAYTSKNTTAFYTVGLSDYAENCAEMLSDMYFNSKFDESTLAKEKTVVLEEIKMSEDDYEDKCLENLVKAHFGKGKSIAYPILGSADNVLSFDKIAIKEFMAKFYVPKNTVISIAGDISAERAAELVDKYFERQMKNAEFSKRKFGINKPQNKYLETSRSDCQQSHVAISFPAYGLKNKKSTVNAILCNLLAGGMSSRLFQKIRDELGLVYTIYASPVSYVDDGYWYIYFATDPKQVPLALEEIRKSLDEIKKKGFTGEELKRTLIQSKTALILSMESAMSVMRVNARSMLLLNKKYNVNRQLKELEAITNDDVNETIHNSIRYDKASVSYVGRKPSFNAYDIFMGKE